MVPAIDLRPLSEEEIKDMGYGPQDLWMVKLESIVFGPFETETLRHYVSENEHLFEKAEASLSNEKGWKPFWSHTKFQRRKLSSVPSSEDGPFWLMQSGIKVGPFSNQEIDKKLEMGILGMTDNISVDDGHHWTKIYNIKGFDRRTYTPDDLPLSPSENSFQLARLALAEKLETPHVSVSAELAEMAHSGQQEAKVLQFKVEELTLQQTKSAEVSPALKWAVPAAAAVVFTFVATGYMTLHTEEPEEITVTENEPVPAAPSIRRTKKAPQGEIATPVRAPASVGYSQRVEPRYEAPKYPTYIETHDQHYDDPGAQDPIEAPMNEMEQPQEHSLIGNNNNNSDPENTSLDAAMNGGEEIPQPAQVEEVSDF